MTGRTDRILAVIDAGLQTPVPDPTYGDFHERNTGMCCRCNRHDPVEGSDWCGWCRSYLLGDDTDDPDPRVVRPQMVVREYGDILGVSWEPGEQVTLTNVSAVTVTVPEWQNQAYQTFRRFLDGAEELGCMRMGGRTSGSWTDEPERLESPTPEMVEDRLVVLNDRLAVNGLPPVPNFLATIIDDLQQAGWTNHTIRLVPAEEAE